MYTLLSSKSMSKSSILDRLLWIVEIESINEFWAARKYFWNPKYFPVFYFDASSYVVLYNQNLTRFPIPTYYIKNTSCWSKNTQYWIFVYFRKSKSMENDMGFTYTSTDH